MISDGAGAASAGLSGKWEVWGGGAAADNRQSSLRQRPRLHGPRQPALKFHLSHHAPSMAHNRLFIIGTHARLGTRALAIGSGCAGQIRIAAAAAARNHTDHHILRTAAQHGFGIDPAVPAKNNFDLSGAYLDE